jgi:diguanylate cyclase (GGDEF)-like protein
MADRFGDARLEELKLLSEIERNPSIARRPEKGPWRDLIAFLIQARFVNDLQLDWDHTRMHGAGGLAGETPLERELHAVHIDCLSKVLAGQEIQLALTHRGRVRLSELKQALRAGREREPFGILWDVRHWEQELQVAILDAREGSPLALAYLDMNGLKQVNDTQGHEVGDLALKTYFQAVASALGDRGQAYRLGGDEVLVILPNHDVPAAVQLLRLACAKLMSERLERMDGSQRLSIAAGVITSCNPSVSPTDLRAAADKVQYRAKEQSKQSTPRPSVIAIEGQENMIVIE